MHMYSRVSCGGSKILSLDSLDLTLRIMLHPDAKRAAYVFMASHSVDYISRITAILAFVVPRAPSIVARAQPHSVLSPGSIDALI
jgi:hypothetical protein